MSFKFSFPRYETCYKTFLSPFLFHFSSSYTDSFLHLDCIHNHHPRTTNYEPFFFPKSLYICFEWAQLCEYRAHFADRVVRRPSNFKSYTPCSKRDVVLYQQRRPPHAPSYTRNAFPSLRSFMYIISHSQGPFAGMIGSLANLEFDCKEDRRRSSEWKWHS